jgi:Tfp pilus assembly protein PilF
VPDARPAPTTQELLAAAEDARHAGRLDDARALFTRAGARTDGDAEAAWVSLARLELRAGRPAAARDAIAQHASRFPAGRLGPECGWIDVQAADAAGDRPAALTAARALVARWPASPQAAQARTRFSMQQP